jgi:ribonuclease D
VLHKFLTSRIAAYGHQQWADAACAIFEDPQWHLTDLASQQRKIEGTRRFKPVERRILHRLVHTRDEIARDEDLPPRSAIPDNVLLAITRDRPSSSDAIANLKGMPRPIAGRHGERLLAAIEAGREAADAPQPRRTREESPIDRVAIDGLWHAYSAAAIGAGVSPALALSRAELAGWYLGERAGTPGKAPWQREIVASFLEPLLSGERTLVLEWRNDALRLAEGESAAKDGSHTP